jgi:signal transduction histidine kinase
MFLLQRLRDAAVHQERMRFARDLHDGLLQSLAGAALQLRATANLIDAHPDDARTRLREIEQMLAGEQADLRELIRELKPAAAASDRPFALTERLEQLAARVRRQWGVEVQLALREVERLTDRLQREVYRLVHEGVTNAARHAGATAVSVAVENAGPHLQLSIGDNGHGFPFQGNYSLEDLLREHAGPATIKERVSALGGQLQITSSHEGARLRIQLPTRDARG